MKKKYLYNGEYYTEAEMTDFAKQSGVSFDSYIAALGKDVKVLDAPYEYKGNFYTQDEISASAKKKGINDDAYLSQYGIKKKEEAAATGAISSAASKIGGQVGNFVGQSEKDNALSLIQSINAGVAKGIEKGKQQFPNEIRATPEEEAALRDAQRRTGQADGQFTQQGAEQFNLLATDPLRAILDPEREKLQAAYNNRRLQGVRQTSDNTIARNNIDPNKTVQKKDGKLIPDVSSNPEYQVKNQEQALENVSGLVKNKFFKNGKEALEYAENQVKSGIDPTGNETIEHAITKAGEYKQKEESALNGKSIIQNAIEIQLQNDPLFKKQYETIINGTASDAEIADVARRFNIPLDKLKTQGSLPQEVVGELVHRFISDPDIKQIAEDNPEFKKDFANFEGDKIYEVFPEYADVYIKNTLSRARELAGKNNWFANPIFDKSKYMDNLAEEVFKNRPILLKRIKDKFHNNWEHKIETTGIVDDLGTGARGAMSGMWRSLKDVTGFGKSYSDRIRNTLKEQYGHVETPYQNEFRKVVGEASNFMGMVLAMGATGSGLGNIGKGLGVMNPSVASKAVTLATFFDDELNHAASIYPENPTKAYLRASLSTAFFLVAGDAIPASKITGFKQNITQTLKSLETKALDKQAKMKLRDKILSVATETLQGTAKGTAEMTVMINGFKLLIDRALGLDESSINNEYSDANLLATAKSMLFGLPVPSMIHGFKGINRTRAAIYEMASNPEKYKSAILKRFGSDDPRIADIDFIADFKKSLDSMRVAENEKAKMVFNALHAKRLREQKIPDAFMKRNHEERIRAIEQEQQDLFDGKDLDAGLTDSQKAIKTAYENGEINEMMEAQIKEALKDPAKADQFIKEIAEQATGAVAPELGNAKDGAIKFFGETLTDFAIGKSGKKDGGESVVFEYENEGEVPQKLKPLMVKDENGRITITMPKDEADALQKRIAEGLEPDMELMDGTLVKKTSTTEPVSPIPTEQAEALGEQVKARMGDQVSEGTNKEALEYAMEKVAEAPIEARKQLGDELFEKVLEATPTEKLQEGLDFLIDKNSDDPNVKELDRIISEREKKGSTPEQKSDWQKEQEAIDNDNTLSEAEKEEKKIESTAKALDDKYYEDKRIGKQKQLEIIDLIPKEQIDNPNENGFYRVSKMGDAWVSKQPNEVQEKVKKLNELFKDRQKEQIISEAYHKALKDGSNPELVKAVEELLSKEQATQEVKAEQPTVPQKESAGKEVGSGVGGEVKRTAKPISKRIAVEHAGHESAKRVTGANENTLEIDGYGTIPTSTFINTLVENGRLSKDALKNRHIQLTEEYATKLLNENSDLFPKENTETSKVETNIPTFENAKKEYDDVKSKYGKHLKKDGGLRANTPENVKKEIDDAYQKMQTLVKQERDKRVAEDKRDTGLVDGIDRIRDNASAMNMVKLVMSKNMIPERQFNEFGKNLLHIVADAKDSHEVTIQTAEIIQDFTKRANVKIDDTVARELQAAENLKFEPVDESLLSKEQPTNQSNPALESVESTAIIQNFTQFADERGYPSDYDTMFNAQLLGGRGLEGKRQSDRSIKAQNDDFSKMQEKNKQAHKEYEQAILDGKVIDPDGKLTREGILKRDYEFNKKELESKITNAESGIKNIERLGKMSHLDNGKLKKGYQRAVDDYKETISKHKETLDKLKKEYEKSKLESLLSKEQAQPNESTQITEDNSKKDVISLIKKIKRYATEVIANRKEIRRLSREAEQGRKDGGRRNVEAAVLLLTGGKESTKIEGREAQQQAIEEYAKQEGIWFDNLEVEPTEGTETDLGTYIDSGVENQVYIPKDNPKIVRKAMRTTDPFNKNNPNEVLYHLDTRISEHNAGIGKTVPYTVIGFGKLSNGDFVVITEQPHIQNARLATRAEIKSEMEKMGYEQDGKDSFGNDNYFITDVNPKNVLVDGNGNLHFIDTIYDILYDVNENSSETVIVPTEPTPSAAPNPALRDVESTAKALEELSYEEWEKVYNEVNTADKVIAAKQYFNAKETPEAERTDNQERLIKAVEELLAPKTQSKEQPTTAANETPQSSVEGAANPALRDVESKKADIERRRQEELESNASGIRVKLETYNTLDVSGEPVQVEITTNKDGSRVLKARVINEDGSIDPMAFTAERINNESQLSLTNEKLIEGYIGNEDNTLKKVSENLNPPDARTNKINAKYDAELEALNKQPKKETNPALRDVESEKQQIKDFGVNEKDVDATHGVLNQVFSGLKKAGLTAAKTVGDWVGIGKGAEKPYSLKIDGKEVQVKPVAAEAVNGFYSNTENALAQAKENKMSGNKWKQQLLSRGGKAEEMKWTTLTDFLDTNKDKPLTKEQIAQHLKDNRIEIVEVVKGEPTEEDIQALLNDEVGETFSREEAIEYLRNDEYGENDRTKFSQYQEPGDKEGYKEVLITMPSKPETKPETYSVKEENGKYYAVNDRTGEKLVGNKYTKEESQQQAEQMTARWALNGGRTETAKFKSSHFDEPNILVHLRMNTRTDAEGKKVLFLEEVQSDWGQKGKKEGFSEKAITLTPENTTVELSPSGRAYRLMKDGLQYADMTKETGDNFSKKDLHSELIYLANKYGKNEEARKIAPAPFVTDTNSWTKLGLKVALKEAVKQGADKIAWTTGEQQNDRYDLSKQVDEISTKKYPDGTYTIIGYKDGNSAFEQNDVPENRLEEYVGKDLAKKISDKHNEEVSFRKGAIKEFQDFQNELQDSYGKAEVRTLESYLRHPNNENSAESKKYFTLMLEAKKEYEGVNKGDVWNSFRGVDLKVGGKGMKGFYGSPTEGSLGIVGNVAKSLFKQEPKTVVISKGNAEKNIETKTLDELNNANKGNKELWIENKENGNIFSASYTEAKNALSKGYKVGYLDNGKDISTQHSIDITPELKASVEGGQPLFKDAEAQYRIESGKNIVEAIKDFNGSPRATVALTHEIMHPTVVAIIDGAKEGNETGARHANTIVEEYNKANPDKKITLEQMIEGNDAFINGRTTSEYRAVQEFIAEAWEKYHHEGAKGFSKAFQEVLDAITEVFRQVYKSLTGTTLTPELRKMFDELLGKENVSEAAKVKTPEIGEKTKNKFSDLKEKIKQKQSLKIVSDEAENRHANSKLTEADNPVQEPNVKALESEGENAKNAAQAENVIIKIDSIISAATDVGLRKVSDISTDEKRFQGRDKLNAEKVQEIAENWKDADQDPIHVWTDPKDGKTYVLSGHHRLAAAKQAGREKVKVIDRSKDFTEEQAIRFAKEEANANRTMETAIERANTLRQKRERGDTKDDINKFLDREGKNKNFVNNLSRLNPKGKTIEALRATEKSDDKVTQKEVEKIADWIGEARDRNKNLTDAHENELFDFLMDREGSKRITTKQDFLSKVNSLAGAMDFNANEPLNIARYKHKTEGEKLYDKEAETQKGKISDLQQRINEINDRIKNPNNPQYLNPDSKDYEEIKKNADNKLSELNTELQAESKALLDLYQQKGKFARQGTEQSSLFSTEKNETELPEDYYNDLRDIIKDLKDEHKGITLDEIKEIAKNELGEYYSEPDIEAAYKMTEPQPPKSAPSRPDKSVLTNIV